MPISATIAQETEFKPTSEKVCLEQLPQAIETVFNQPHLQRARWGIAVQTVQGERVYSKEGNKFFIPASNAKLFVTAAALLELGANHRIKTPIYATGNRPHLDTLRLEAHGDPTITTKTLLKLSAQLKSLGVKSIGNLIVDDSFVPQPHLNPTWEWLDIHSYYGTAANSAILNENTVTLTLLPQQPGAPVKFFWDDAIAARQWQVVNQAKTGALNSNYNIKLDGHLGQPRLYLRGELPANDAPDIWDLAVVDPGQYFLESWRKALSQHQIHVNRGTVASKATKLPGEQELLSISSPPLQNLLTTINQKSNNLYAEILGKYLAKILGQEDAAAAIKSSLSRLEITPEEYFLTDVSGLSRQNLLTPQILVELLGNILQDSTGPSYQKTLAIAGINGTLSRRFSQTKIANNLWGKTGTLTGVSTLSGYLYSSTYKPLIFSILINNSSAKNHQLRLAIDQIVVILDNLQKC